MSTDLHLTAQVELLAASLVLGPKRLDLVEVEVTPNRMSVVEALLKDEVVT